jgi:negative regulator of sigma E activity
MTAETHPVEREQLMAYLDGELAANEAARVAAHLTECAECQRLEADLRSVSAQMLSWNVESAPQQFNDGVHAALEANPSQHAAPEPWNLFRFVSQHRIRIARWTLAAACLGVATMILIKIFDEPLAKLVTDARLNPYSNSSASSKAPVPQKKVIEMMQLPETSVGRIRRGEEEKRTLSAPSMPAPQPRARMAEAPHADEISSIDDYLAPTAPMIARTASLKISAKDFQSARAGVDRIIATFHGFAASMTINNAVGEPQSLNAELHFPAAQCDAALAALKSLGRVEQEQQGGEEVTAQVVDLDARLKNARETETRLQDILKTRTGKVSDVLEVENQIAETRQSIEQMEGEQKQLRDRITFSAITLDLHEEYQASLETNDPSAGRRIRNAVVDGFRAAAEGSLALLVFLLSAGPSLLLAAVILFWPIRWAWRRLRNSAAAPAPAQ